MCPAFGREWGQKEDWLVAMHHNEARRLGARLGRAWGLNRDTLGARLGHKGPIIAPMLPISNTRKVR